MPLNHMRPFATPPAEGLCDPRALHSPALLLRGGLPAAVASHGVSEGSPQTGGSSERAATNTRSCEGTAREGEETGDFNFRQPVRKEIK